MNTEKHFLRLVPALNFNQIRVSFRGTILYKQYGDLFVVMINEPKEKIPDNLYGLTIRDVEMSEHMLKMADEIVRIALERS